MDVAQPDLFLGVGNMFKSTKRSRAEDEDELDELRFDRKKPRTLPFRCSPTTKHTFLFSQSSRPVPKPLLTPVVTPVESSEDEDENPAYPFPTSPKIQPPPPTLNSTFYADEGLDFDMDMADSQPSTSPAPWNKAARAVTSPKQLPYALLPLPVNRNTQDSVNGGRIPTPIYGYFRSIDTSMDMDDPDISYDPTISLSKQELDQKSYLRRRRLPTPISEDEAMESSTMMTGDMLDRLDMATDIYEPQPPLQRQEKNHTMLMGQASPGFKGGKMTLSMGFKADCEKCRMRVPGHYNHVIRS